MDEVRCDKFRDEGWDDIGEENDSFGYGWSDEVERRGEDYHVENIVD